MKIHYNSEQKNEYSTDSQELIILLQHINQNKERKLKNGGLPQ